MSLLPQLSCTFSSTAQGEAEHTANSVVKRLPTVLSKGVAQEYRKEDCISHQIAAAAAVTPTADLFLAVPVAPFETKQRCLV